MQAKPIKSGHSPAISKTRRQKYPTEPPLETLRQFLIPGIVLLILSIPISQSNAQSIYKSLFTKRDRNGDGFLSQNELPSSVRPRMKRIDSNADGKISLAGFQKLLAKMNARNTTSSSVKFEKERHSDWFIYELANRKHETIAPNMRQKDDPANRHIRKFIEKYKR